MKLKLKPRELLWMTLPVLIIGGSVWSLPLIRQLSGGAPVGLETGTPRIELGKWTRLQPSVVEIARGLSAKVEVTAWTGGQCPASSSSITESYRVDYPHQLRLAFLRNGKWFSQPFDYVDSRMDVRMSELPVDGALSRWSRNNGRYWTATSGRRIAMNIPMERVPHDATEVRLQGHLEGDMACYSSNSRSNIKPQSPPIDVVLKAPEEAWPIANVPHQSDLRFLRAEQRQWKNSVPYGDDTEVTGYVQFTDKQSPHIGSPFAWIEDGNKKVINREVSGNCGTEAYIGTRCMWSFGNYTLKGRGPFTLNAWVATSPDKWPLLVKIPLPVKPSKPTR